MQKLTTEKNYIEVMMSSEKHAQVFFIQTLGDCWMHFPLR